MPRTLTDSGRIELRVRPEDKATLTRAAALKRLDLTGYILGKVLPQAEADIAEAERFTLSERDSLRVLDLLENPPAAPNRLVRRFLPVKALVWEEMPLAKHHDRAAFDCGDVDLNLYLQRYARQNHESGGAKCFVAAPADMPAHILGFYTLSPPRRSNTAAHLPS
jgi:uncharacterized protein (DUF1778 family)